jgi:hypothetical protein
MKGDLMNSLKSKARFAGLLYLIVGIFGGFSQGFVQPSVYHPGQPEATAAALTANADLVRWGVAADLTQATVFLFLALTLYRLFKPTNEAWARAMVTLVAVAVGIMGLNNAFEWVAVQHAGNPELAMVLLDLQHFGVLAAQIFFGLWLVPLGLLGWRSALFPRWLSGLLVAGGACYLINLATLLLLPALGEVLKPWIVLPSAAAEIATVFYLLVVGVRAPLGHLD